MKEIRDAGTKEEIKHHLATIVKHFHEEDRVVREYQLQRIRRLKLYWNSFSQIYWSDTARDYRIFGVDNLQPDDNDQAYYDKPVNVFRAFLETIVAALSIQIPAPHCVPDDAENPDDISTAKAGDSIGELLFKHNDVLYLWLYAMYVHMTEGMVACYTYSKEDKSYGTYQKKQYKDEEVEGYVCPSCKTPLPDDVFEQAQEIKLAEENEFAPDDTDVDIDASEDEQEEPLCPNCAAVLDPNLQKSKLVIPRLVGMTDAPKSRICFKIRGGMYVKIAVYARDFCESPYLIESYETHYSNALEMYPELYEDAPRGGWSNTGVSDPYEWYARLNPQYRNAFPEENVTIKNCWLRPAAFNILPEESAKLLKKHFPDGASVVMVNEIIADFENECIDDCWTVTKNPMFDYLTHEPMGELVVNVQDITNDLISLTLQTIEHGIPQTWVDPAVVDIDAYRQVEASPGTITPTKTIASGKSIKESFYSTTSTSLSPEVFQFYQIIQQLGQFVSGALPAIYGGQQSGNSSRTASEYAMARTNALQRLSTTWRMFTLFWKNIFGKAIPAYMKLIHEDERFVKRNPYGSFVNVWIRTADLKGKIGDIEIESSEQMPVSDDQKADIVMKLMELNNTEIMQALASPENLPFIRKIIKMPQFVLPGEDYRQKYNEEIQILVNSEPQMLPPDELEVGVSLANGMEPPPPQELPSEEADPLLDDHQIAAEIFRSWLVSEAGRLAKIESPQGYKNVLLRFQQHMQLLAMQAQQQAAAMQPPANSNNPAPGKPKGKDPQETQVKEQKDVRTPVQ